jgi:hypothetical protein
MTTFQEKLDALPEMPKRGQASTEALAHVIYHAACHDALRARLALARELLDRIVVGSACSCFLEHRESGDHHKNVCNRCAFLAKLDKEAL